MQASLLDPAFPYGEDLLQFIWEQGLFEHRGLRTTDGRPVEIVRPGRIQRDSGPDLLDARVRIDGQMWAGTIEVHLRSSEWATHGHHLDPAYENVVLHVVYEHDSECMTRAGVELPTVELMPRVSSESISLYHALMRARGFVPCAGLLQGIDRTPVDIWLERVLVERLERKAMEVERLFDGTGNDPGQTLYHVIARAFGMKVNAEPFGMLAQALPLKVLLKHRDDPFRTEALLFGAAGLLQVDFVDDHPRRLQQEFAVLSRLHSLRPMPVAAWKFGRMRPMNLPTVRIAQLAGLISSLETSFNDLLQLDEVQAYRKRLDAAPSQYWLNHYVLDKPSQDRPKRMGVIGADHILLNAIIPCLFAFGRLQGRDDYAQRALRLLERLPSERNSLLDGWSELGLRAEDAGRGQALIELRNSYCAHRRCLSCGIGNQLLKRTVN